MKQKLFIYSNSNSHKLLNQIYNNHEFVFRNIEELFEKNENKEGGIIIYNKDEREIEIDLSKLKNNYVLITNENNSDLSLKENILFISAPLSIDKVKSKITKFIFNKKIVISNIQIVDKKLINNENHLTCFLTDIENEILIYLISSNNCTKEYIKTNILNLNTNVETYSLDSHLTRIRKKLESIKSPIKITSKKDEVMLSFSQKN